MNMCECSPTHPVAAYWNIHTNKFPGCFHVSKNWLNRPVCGMGVCEEGSGESNQGEGTVVFVDPHEGDVTRKPPRNSRCKYVIEVKLKMQRR